MIVNSFEGCINKSKKHLPQGKTKRAADKGKGPLCFRRRFEGEETHRPRCIHLMAEEEAEAATVQQI